MPRSHRFITPARALTCCLALALGWPALALADTARFEIKAEPLSVALKAFAQQAHMQLLYEYDTVRDIQGNPVVGVIEKHAALIELLRNTGLEPVFSSEVAATIKPIPAHRSGAAPSKHTNADGNSNAGTRNRTDTPRLSQLGQEPAEPNSREQKSSASSELQEVVVTGTRIKGATPTSPVIEITQREMIQAGQNNLGEVIRSIPQNFSGGQNPAVSLGAGGSNSNQDDTGGAALNLRGLGPDATLTLLDGHRLAYDGFTQGVDLSVIPVDALDRIEIVTDGASAIYGSDAVGGVANIILKHDYDGLSVASRVGRATDGGDFQRQYGVVGGKVWSGGGFIATFDYNSATAVYSSQRNFTLSLPEPHMLVPTELNEGVILGGHQDIGSIATLKIDSTYSDRKSNSIYTYYSEGENSRSGTTYDIAPTVTFHLPGEWSLSLNGIYGVDDIYDQTYRFSGGLRKPATNFCYCNRAEAAEVSAEGSLHHLPAGDVQLAVGAGYHQNLLDIHYKNQGSTVYGQQKDAYGYGELFVPIISAEQGVGYIRNFSASAAFRTEHYNRFGGITTPKFGLTYEPTEDFALKGTWGESYKAPTLDQTYQQSQAILFGTPTVGGTSYPPSATALVTYGGNSALKPERAKSWTGTFTLHPTGLPGLHADISCFNIDYADRVVQPIVLLSQALSNPIYAQFVTYSPSAAQQQAIISSASGGFTNVTAVPYNPAEVVADIADTYANAASQRISGVDISGLDTLDLTAGSLTLSSDFSWLNSKQKTTNLSGWQKLADTVYNPPHLKSRSGITWESRGLTLSAFYNYIGGVTNNAVSLNADGASMSTVDLVALYRLPTSFDLTRVDFSFSVLNVGDTSPPYLKNTSIYLVNYDSTNYSPIGRFVDFSVTLHM